MRSRFAAPTNCGCWPTWAAALRTNCRNSATGCGLVLDLHSQECSSGDSCESLSVANGQLQLMEEYLQRFLQLGKASGAPADDVIDLAAVDDILPLIEPAVAGRPRRASLVSPADATRRCAAISIACDKC